MSAKFEPITGRYMHLDLLGRPHRLYVEEAGEGTPLLCLHTAGADGRQYRALMNDPRSAVGITGEIPRPAGLPPTHPPRGGCPLCSARFSSGVTTVRTGPRRGPPTVRV